MNPGDISAIARHPFDTQGANAIAHAAQQAASFDVAGDGEQSRMWRRVEAELREMRGPRES